MRPLPPRVVPSIRPRLLLPSFSLALWLAACGGGGGSDLTPPALEALPDTLAAPRGDDLNLLANDRIAGAPARAGADGNATLTLLTGADTVALTLTPEGLLSTASQPPGRWQFSYRLCTRDVTPVCAQTAVTLDLRVAPLQFTAQALSVWKGEDPVDLTRQVMEGSVSLPWPRLVTVSARAPLPTGLVLDEDGGLRATDAALPGPQTIALRVCPRDAGTGCVDVDQTVTVEAQAGLRGVTLAPAQRLDFSDGPFRDSQPCSAAGGFFTGCGEFDWRLDTPFPTWWRTGPATGGVDDAQVPLQRELAPAAGVRARVLVRGLPQSPAVLGADGRSASASGLSLSWRESLRPGDGFAVAAQAAFLTALDARQFPLAQRWTPAGGSPTPFRLLAAAHLAVTDGTDTLRLQDAVLTLAPLPDVGALPATATVLHHDLAGGRWTEAGSARLVDVDGQPRYEVTAPPNGSLAVVLPDTTVAVDGCVRDPVGRPLPFARVQALRDDHAGSTETRADADGRFRLALSAGAAWRVAAIDRPDPEVPSPFAPVFTQAAGTPVALTTGTAGQSLPACLVAEGPADLVWNAEVVRETYFGQRVSRTVVLAPDGTLHEPPSDLALHRPKVGTWGVYVRRTVDAGAVGWYGFALPPVTVRGRELAPRRLAPTARLLQTAPAAAAWWHVADVVIAADCRPTLQWQDRPVAELPPRPAAAPACVPAVAP